MTTFNLRDYTKFDKLKKKIYNTLISNIDDMYIRNDISFEEIKSLYDFVGKKIPNKFDNSIQLSRNESAIYDVLYNELKVHSEEMKERYYNHYHEMVDSIAPDYIIDKNEFIKLAKQKINDINVIVNCVVCYFHPEEFYKLVESMFEYDLKFTAHRIYQKVKSVDDELQIEIKDLKFDRKGLDVKLMVNNQPLHARAVVVHGVFVKFHYRYIVN